MSNLLVGVLSACLCGAAFGADIPVVKYNPKARDFSSWNGGWVHAVDDFGELKLGL